MSSHARYVALGDSMSIDLYPRLELQALGRIGPEEVPGVGAASLLERNDDGLWPEFRGRDLRSLRPGLERLDLCVDGAVIRDVLERQLPLVPAEVGGSAELVTLTAGGNDLLGGVFDGLAGLERRTDEAIRAYRALVNRVVERFPEATVLLTTVYDPTDGSGMLPGLSQELGRLPIELLDRFNDAVRDHARRHPRARLADAHRHFLGHGVAASGEDFWYWQPNPIEPGARGASEIRRLWLDALD